jgi:tRNA-splicing endonuclease subunit Sen2
MASDNTANPTYSAKAPPPQQPTKPFKPNYRHIHRFPLPLIVHPLPPLIPHNPLSVISVFLSYLTYFISAPKHEVYSAYFDSATSSVHVTDEKAIRALWEMGFFGKGSLSRSEPSWLEREKKIIGLQGSKTSEETTGKRRAERREWKLERAKKEKEAIAQTLKEEAAVKDHSTTPLNGFDEPQAKNGVTNQSANGIMNVRSLNAPGEQPREAEAVELEPSVLRDVEINASDNPVGNKLPNSNKTVRFSSIVEETKFVPELSIPATTLSPTMNGDRFDEESVQDEEHLQLSNEEAFFLVYGLGALRVFDDRRQSAIPTTSLLQLFRQHSYFPCRDSSAGLESDDPFMISYVVYHHFRSLGWVVRSGVKFGVDYLLYNRGPVFSHAEFAVVILPSYEHPYWFATEERRTRASRKQTRSWWWLHCVNRVQAQVKKTLVLCFVDIPPSTDTPHDDIGLMLGHYKVREMIIKRWVPNRSRD